MSTSASSQILDKYSTPPRYIFAATPLHDIKHSCENGSVDSKFMNDVNSTSAIGVKKTNSIIGSAIKELGEDTSNEIEKVLLNSIGYRFYWVLYFTIIQYFLI